MKSIRIASIVITGILLLASVAAYAQQVGTAISADGAPPNTNAMLDVQSPSIGDGKGMLIPRVTLAQRTTASEAEAGGLLDDSGDLRGGAAQGLVVYQTDATQGFYYNTSATATPAWSYVDDGDFMADGSVAMTGALNAGGNAVTNALYYGDGSGLTNIPSGSISLAGHDVTELDDVSSAGSGAIITTSERGLMTSNQTAIASETAARIGADAGLSNTVASLQSDTSFISNNYVRRDGTLSMTGNLDMGGTNILNVGSLIGFNGEDTAAGNTANGAFTGTAVGYMANGRSGGVAVGHNSTGPFSGVAVGKSANGSNGGAVVGNLAQGVNYGSAIGYDADANEYGTAVGIHANGIQTNVAIGAYADAQGGSERIAIGHNVTNAVDNSAAIRGNLYLDGATNVMVRSTFGSGGWTPLVGAAGDFKSDGSVAMTGDLNMGGQNIIGVASNIAFSGDEIAIGKNATADWGNDGVAIGSSAAADLLGAAVGYQANGQWGGASLGYRARSYYYGVAMGFEAFATNYGTAVGNQANAMSLGVAVGASAKGYIQGAAVGASANGAFRGTALGYYANAIEGGIALGYDANGLGTNIAIGYYASAYDGDNPNGGDRIAIGRYVTNLVEDSCAIRGTLYLDGGTGVLYRSTFGTGAWSALGGGGGGISSFGYCYDLAGGGQVVAGGADVLLSNNGPLSSITHTAGTTTMTVPNAGTYKIEYSVTITAGIGAQMAIAVNGLVDASTAVDIMVATGNISGTAMLTLAGGDVLTIRNNSATPFTTTMSPGVGAQITITQLN
ncbi:MAG: hypothetical protein EOM20_17790 [Spartobacteria bacterium]|nr:hypothetical protein [Spartobacteria bacterium]